jgi:hypothetical protein
MNADQPPHDTPHDLYSVNDAAHVLGISPEAIRSRLHRGSLERVKMNDGSVMVRLNADDARQDGDHTNDQTVEDTVVYKLQADQIEFLRRELERKDSIIMSLTQRIPELESSPEPRESILRDSEGSGRGSVPPEKEKSSWWRRVFLGEQ